MRPLLLLLPWLAALAAGCESPPAEPSARADAVESRAVYPKVFFQQAHSLDLKLCDSTPIADSVLEDARSMLPAFQSAWDADAASLLGTAVNEVGRPFVRKEETVSLMVCPRLISMGTPLLITYWPFLESTSAMMGGTPRPILYFKGVVFHELLHTYVNSILGWSGSTPLLTKYANEPDKVRRHLHVDAIQKLVYQRLGRAADLAAIVESDGANFGPDYKRAWQIVNDLEDARAFAAELR